MARAVYGVLGLFLKERLRPEEDSQEFDTISVLADPWKTMLPSVWTFSPGHRVVIQPGIVSNLLLLPLRVALLPVCNTDSPLPFSRMIDDTPREH